jgi:peptidoglycan/LPS O-acetylase OafA/YrhL
MKLPSLQQVVQDATRTFLRFPVVLIFAAVGTFAAVMLIDHEGPPQATILFNVLLASILGIPMLLAFALIAEKKKWSRLLSIGVQLLGVLLLAAYGFTIPADLGNAPAIYIIRQLMLAVALHLFVAFAP